MYKVAVVDDEFLCCKRLESYFERYKKEKNEQFQIRCFQRGAAFLDAYEQDYDLVFLDIDMPGLDGMQTAKELRLMDEDVGIIFVTNLARYALHGYEVNALDFIVKPVQYESFAYKLRKALRIQQHFREENTIMLQHDGVTQKVNVSDILYVEADGSYVIYYTQDQSYRVRGPLKNVERDLTEQGFLRCNHGCIVNLQCVTNLKNDTVVVGTQELPISRNRKKDFVVGLTAWLGRKI